MSKVLAQTFDSFFRTIKGLQVQLLMPCQGYTKLNTPMDQSMKLFIKQVDQALIGLIQKATLSTLLLWN